MITKNDKIHQLQRALEQERSAHAQTRKKCRQYLSTSLQFKQRLDAVGAEIKAHKTIVKVCDSCQGSGWYEQEGCKTIRECGKCNGTGAML